MHTLARSLQLLASLSLLAAVATGVAADLEREARLARDLRAAVRAGEPLMLDVPKRGPEPQTARGNPSGAAAPPDAEPRQSPADQAGKDDPEKEEPIPVPDGLAVDPPSAETPAEKPEPPPQEKDEIAAGAERKQPAAPQVFALYMPPTGQPERGGAVLLHDLGGHPDWPDVIGPLRRQLPQDGWATLAVQMPLPAPGQPVDGQFLGEAVPRIEAAVAELVKRDQAPVVLIGHGSGAAMAAAYLEEGERPQVAAAVVINPGLPTGDSGGYDLTTPLTRAELPVLNLYGSEAPYYVLETAEALAGGKVTPFRILGADYAFADTETALVTRVRGWLRGAPKGAKGANGGQEGGAGDNGG